VGDEGSIPLERTTSNRSKNLKTFSLRASRVPAGDMGLFVKDNEGEVREVSKEEELNKGSGPGVAKKDCVRRRTSDLFSGAELLAGGKYPFVQ